MWGNIAWKKFAQKKNWTLTEEYLNTLIKDNPLFSSGCRCHGPYFWWRGQRRGGLFHLVFTARIIIMSFHYYNIRSLFLMARWVKELKELLRRLRSSIPGVNCKCYSSPFIKSIFKKRALAITGLAREVIPAWGHDNARWWEWVIRSLMEATTRAVALKVHLSSLPPNDNNPNLHRPRDQKRIDVTRWH